VDTFDEGHGSCSPEDGAAGDYPDFSTRFAAPTGSAKTSMDLGSHHVPLIFHHPPSQQPHVITLPTPPLHGAAYGGAPTDFLFSLS
jgi:hypothetical protein